MPASDLHERIGQGVVTTIKNIGLTHNDGTTATSVYDRTVAGDDGTIDYPCVMVLWQDGTEEEGDHAFEAQYVAFPNYVILVDRQPGEDKTWRPGFLGWRKQILDTLRPLMTLPGCPEVWDVRIKPMTILPSDLFRQQEGYQHVVSGLVVNAYTSEAWTHA